MKEFLLVILNLCMFFCIFLIFRNMYTFGRLSFSSKLIHNYTSYLIWEADAYDMLEKYHDKFEVDYDKHLFNIFLWGKYSAIKPEYIEFLKQYENYDGDKAERIWRENQAKRLEESIKKIEEKYKKVLD